MSWAVDHEGTVYDFPSMERIGIVDDSGGIALDEDQAATLPDAADCSAPYPPN